MRSEGYCTWVCVSVWLLSHISPIECLFVLKTLSRSERAMKVKKFVGICLKRLRSRVMPRNMSEEANMLIYLRSTFSTLHTAKLQRIPNDCRQHPAARRGQFPAHAHWHSTGIVATYLHFMHNNFISYYL